MDYPGPITASVERLRSMLARSSAFQARVGADDEVAAEGKIKRYYYDEDPAVLQRSRPFAAIWPADSLDLEQVAGGARNWLDAGGQLVLVLTDVDRVPGDLELSGVEFVAWLDAVLMDLSAQAGTDAALDVRGISLQQRPVHSPRSDEPAAGSYWHAALLIRWGQGGGA